MSKKIYINKEDSIVSMSSNNKSKTLLQIW